MASSKSEQVLEAIKALLVTVPNAKVERNTAVPEKIPTGGLIVLRDGDPGDPETALGGFGGVYYSHEIEIELYIEQGDATVRDAAFDILVQSIGTVLEADLTLDGLAFGMSYVRSASALMGAARSRPSSWTWAALAISLSRKLRQPVAGHPSGSPSCPIALNPWVAT